MLRSPCSDRSPVIVRAASNVSSTLLRRKAVESRLSSVSALPPVDVTPVTPSLAATSNGIVCPVNAEPTLEAEILNCKSTLSARSLLDPLVNVLVMAVLRW